MVDLEMLRAQAEAGYVSLSEYSEKRKEIMTDEAILEAMARAIHNEMWEGVISQRDNKPIALDCARAALAVARPLIEAEERERCAKVAEAHVLFDWSKLPKAYVKFQPGMTIAAAIRKQEQPQ